MVVVRTGRNKTLNSDYATYADIWRMLQQPLFENKLAVGFSPGAVRKEGETFAQKLTMHVWHEEGEKMDCEFEVLLPDHNRATNITMCQGMGQTYGKRYALVNMFNLIVGNDDDAELLGQTVTDAAPRPDKEAHWRQFCHVPVFDLGTAETAATWSMLADPSDESGHQVLGDLQGGTMAKLWCKYPDNAGINAWRAELIGERAKAQQIRNWDECVSLHKTLHLPSMFVECTGEQLNKLALALASKQPEGRKP